MRCCAGSGRRRDPPNDRRQHPQRRQGSRDAVRAGGQGAQLRRLLLPAAGHDGLPATRGLFRGRGGVSKRLLEPSGVDLLLRGQPGPGGGGAADTAVPRGNLREGHAGPQGQVRSRGPVRRPSRALQTPSSSNPFKLKPLQAPLVSHSIEQCTCFPHQGEPHADPVGLPGRARDPPGACSLATLTYMAFKMLGPGAPRR